MDHTNKPYSYMLFVLPAWSASDQEELQEAVQADPGGGPGAEMSGGLQVSSRPDGCYSWGSTQSGTGN